MWGVKNVGVLARQMVAMQTAGKMVVCIADMCALPFSGGLVCQEGVVTMDGYW
jgi:hypothetical protein